MFANRQQEINAQDCFIGVLGQFFLAAVIAALVFTALLTEIQWYWAGIIGLIVGIGYFSVAVRKFLD